MKSIVIFALLLIAPNIAAAQESGMPTQSGTQEPEVPGNPPPAPGQPPSDPDSVHVPPDSGPQKQDRVKKLDEDECVPGKDAKTCVESQRGRK
ncbi:hypothetical protein WH297_10570 [Ochrobactrum vermis]|uniref:Uncharacterized protein n=1 Tax=Ochrobactrum vermis TaxID=1827297 RepID=A0ABU8PD55_9HYPH|nr:hypothetical protein [Ochrobactrum vermis]PQZ30545.1 hypothetical protein CQZ93_10755 [Ochrobactrum vermis]